VDLYLSWPDAPEDADECCAQLAAALQPIPFAHDVRRTAIGVCPGGARPVSYFTFRPRGAGLVEDELVRGLHPMVARRLDLWRLRDFDITRIDAPEDILIYHCIAKDNTADQRLVAMAQVRELAVVRDDEDRISSLPQVERVIASCVEGIRRGRVRLRSSSATLDMNHVWVHIWPTIDAELDQLTALQRDIAPLTAEAGIDRGARAGPGGHAEGHDRPRRREVLLPTRLGVQFTGRAAAGPSASAADDYAHKVLRARPARHDLPVRAAADGRRARGTVVEHDLDGAGRLVRWTVRPG